MSYLNVYVGNPCKIEIERNNLSITTNEKNIVPLEDVNAVMVESQHCQISSYAINSLIEQKAVIFFCDGKHLPSTIVLPQNGYYKKLKIIKQQIEMPKPAQKQLWRKIVIRKIENQQKCLQLCTANESKKMCEFVQNVLSNDSSNCEAQAASYYFKMQFGLNFQRRDQNIINSFLNYGYAILRGVIARTLIVFGFECALGIFHKNELNAFNLADDVIEIFRPFVDLFIIKKVAPFFDALTPSAKQTIFSMLACNMLFENEKQTISNAVEKTVISLKNCFENKNSQLTLPELIDVFEHKYE